MDHRIFVKMLGRLLTVAGKSKTEGYNLNVFCFSVLVFSFELMNIISWSNFIRSYCTSPETNPY